MGIIQINNNQHFQKTTDHKAALVVFTAPWCGPCLSQEPIINTVADTFKNSAIVVSVNVDHHPDLALTFDVKSVPTLIVLLHGKERQRFIGVQPENILSEALTKVLNG